MANRSAMWLTVLLVVNVVMWAIGIIGSGVARSSLLPITAVGGGVGSIARIVNLWRRQEDGG